MVCWVCVCVCVCVGAWLVGRWICGWVGGWVGVCVNGCVCVWVGGWICVCVCGCVCVGVWVNGCVFFIIDIQHAPLHSNTTCFRVKYSHYGHIYSYLPLMYNFFYVILIQQFYFRFYNVVRVAF